VAVRTKFQQKAIRNFYQNRGDIALQRAQELVTELYLSEGKARERNWKLLVTHLQALGVKPAQIEHLRKEDKPELVAKLVQELMQKQ
jgi:hypothetical protein